MEIDLDVKNILNNYKDQVFIINDSDEILEKFSDKFHWIGSKIDWSQTKNHISKRIGKNDNWGGEVKKFVKDNNLEGIINKFKLKVYYINDAAIDYSLCFENSILIMADLIDILPQHHYFFDSEINWCLAVSAEGYIDFCEPLRLK